MTALGAKRALLLDLDDTLYDYAPAARAAQLATVRAAASDLVASEADVGAALDAARKTVKARLGNRGSAHARLLYLLEMAHALGRVEALGRVRTWERVYWGTFLEHARLREGARALLSGFHARGGKVAIVTDLNVEIQLWKLEAFGLVGAVDALAVSEEVAHDKPEPEIFHLAMARLGVGADACVMVGDSPSRDGAGAAALGIPYLQALSSEHGGGESLVAIAQRLGASS